jgi:hypothetical protein
MCIKSSPLKGRGEAQLSFSQISGGSAAVLAADFGGEAQQSLPQISPPFILSFVVSKRFGKKATDRNFLQLNLSIQKNFANFAARIAKYTDYAATDTTADRP